MAYVNHGPFHNGNVAFKDHNTMNLGLLEYNLFKNLSNWVTFLVKKTQIQTING